MSNIKDAILGIFYTFIASLLGVIGMLTGYVIWGNGLGDAVEEKTRQLFKKES